MYRYLVFAFDAYYPSGGMEDCQFKTNNRADAQERAHLELREYDQIHIYDAKVDKIIFEIDNYGN